MDKEITILDEETLESTYKKIHYYTNLPKHVKGNTTELVLIPSNLATGDILNPACVVNGTITIRSGRLNIPTLIKCKSLDFI